MKKTRILIIVLTISIVFTAIFLLNNCGEGKVSQSTPSSNESEPLNSEAHVHSFGEWFTVKEPTCTEQGDSMRSCTCGKTEDKKIDALGHDTVTHEAKSPTCEEIGWDSYVTCSRCEHSTYVEKSAIGHILGNDTTCTESQDCTVCGKVISSEQGHIPGVAATCTKAQTCLVCGIVLNAPLGHNEVTHEGENPTCTNFGWDAYVTCSRCDYTTYSKTPAIGHTPGNVATCTAAQICSVCNDILVAALGHNEISHEAKALSCTEISCNAYITCSRCEYTTYKEIAPTGHDYVNTWDRCSHCGEIKASEGLEFTSNGDGTCYVKSAGSCTSAEIVIPKYSDTGDKVIGIGSSAFYESPVAYNHLRKVYIPETVEYIGSYAFFGCSSLRTVIFNEGLIEIGESAFMWCGIQNVDFPESLETIKSQAFYTASLKTVTIPKNVKVIGNEAFGQEIYLTDIVVDEENQYFSSLDGNLYNKDKTALLQYAIAKPSGRFIIPDGVVTIGHSAFCYANNLYEVIIPNGVIKIDDSAFYSSYIEIIDLPDSVKTIGIGAFSYCRNLYTVSLGNGVEKINSDAFRGCERLNYINIPASVNFIDDSVFSECVNLEGIYVNENNSRYYSVDGVLFDQVESMLVAYPAGSTETVFAIPEGVENIGSGAFEGCAFLTKVIIPDGLYGIDYYAFVGCTSLEYVNIPESVDQIRSYAFYECPNLTVYCDFETAHYNWHGDWNDGSCNVVWQRAASQGLEYISNGDGTCYVDSGECTDSNIVIPSMSPNGDRVIGINDRAFYENQHITSVFICDGVEIIGQYAFAACTNLERIIIGSSVNDISYGAFWACWNISYIEVDETNEYYKSLDGNLYSKDGKYLLNYAVANTRTSFAVPDDVEYICEYAFDGCSYLTSIVISDNVKTIGQSAFAGCQQLVEIIIGNSVEYIDNHAFSSCWNVESIKIPISVKTIGDYVFQGCTSLKTVNYAGTEAEWANITINEGNNYLINATINYNC